MAICNINLSNILDDEKLRNVNLLEFYITNNNECVASIPTVQVHDTSVSKDLFYKVMHLLKSRYPKTVYQQFKRSVVGDVFYQNSNNQDITIYTKKTSFVDMVNTHIICVGSNKKKLTILSYPSVQDVDNEEYVKTMNFRISNRLCITLEHARHLSNDESMTYEIKILYTHDTTVDKEAVMKTLSKTLQELSASIC